MNSASVTLSKERWSIVPAIVDFYCGHCPEGGLMKRLNDMLGTKIGLILNGQLPVSLKREEGQGLVEYALILAFIAILLIVALTFLKDEISNVFTDIGDALTP
jgi:pilus assembly protein Flp/PilA